MIKFEQEIFSKCKINTQKLLDYGFEDFDGVYAFSKEIAEGRFIVKVNINDNQVRSEVIDKETKEEYRLIKVESAQGSFLGELREEYKSLLLDIKNKCCSSLTFLNEQAERVNKYIIEKYNIEPDFPWERYPSYAVFRNKENNLWFGLIMDVEDDKLSPGVSRRSVINIKPPKEMFEDLLREKGIYRGWHMNKKSWISISLNDILNDAYVFSLIDLSYEQTLNKQKVRLFPPKKK